MIKDLKSTIKNSFIYGLGNLSTKLVGFILLPLYTSHLSVSDYGILGILEVTTQVLIAVFGLTLYQAFFRWYWDKRYEHTQKEMFFTVLVFLAIVAAGMDVLLCPFSRTFSNLLFDMPNYSFLLKMMIFSASLEIVFQAPSTLIRLQEKPILFTIANILKLTTSLSLTVFFIVRMNKKLEGIYEAQIIGQMVYFLFLLKYIKKNSRAVFEWSMLKDMLVFSFPLALSAFSAVALNISDRYILKFLGGLKDVGLYSLGFKMANTISILVVSSVNLAVSPLIYKKIDQPNNKRFYSKILTYYTFGLMFFVLGMSFFGKEVIKVIAKNPEYWNSYKVIPVISLSILFSMMRDTSMTGLIITKKTKIMSMITIGVAILNIVLDVLFIPYLQSMGAAMGVCISQFVFFMCIYNFSQKYYNIPYEKGKMIKMIVVALTLYGCVCLIDGFSLLVRLLVKSLLIILYPIILYFWNFFEPIEIESLKKIGEKIKTGQIAKIHLNI